MLYGITINSKDTNTDSAIILKYYWLIKQEQKPLVPRLPEAAVTYYI